MLKKIIRVTSILILSIFSFYYTNESIALIRNTDPIMQEIKNTESKYNVSSVDAKIIENTIIPGQVGKEINYEESYVKMKQYGAYNESLITLKEVKPVISIDDYYDKFIVSGNPTKKSVALVFKIVDKSPKEIVTILNKNNTLATFFIDGLYLKNNYKEISTMTNFELELLSYNSSYDELHFTTSKDYLSSITNKDMKFCYSDYDQEEVILLCEKLNLHTVLPTIKVFSNPYQEIKEKLTNSAIIYLPLSTKVEKELPTIINYIKSRGYTFETLDSLLSESIEK